MRLEPEQQAMLDGEKGEAVAFAMRIIIQLGDLFEADGLMPITQVHVDGCCYQTAADAGLDFAEKIVQLGGKVVVPTTTNVSGRDIRKWREHGFSIELAEKCRRMEKAYLAMGAIPTWTCAPYMQGPLPRFGEQIVWAESNAIAYVNSVIGARTHRYGDFIDVCSALTGYAPHFGLHLQENRLPTMLIKVAGFGKLASDDTSFFAALGYWLGKQIEGGIPFIEGIPADVDTDCLKALSAAGAASGSLALFHIDGVTPEANGVRKNARELGESASLLYGPKQMEEVKGELNTFRRNEVDLVALGCPHFSYSEAWNAAKALTGRHVREGTECYIFTNRAVLEDLKATGIADELEHAGVRIATDTCILHWPLKGKGHKVMATNSGKFAKYAPGLLGLDVAFGSLRQCIDAAITGRIS